MRCPRCLHTIHPTAEECPHCGADMGDLDAMFAEQSVCVRQLHDAAGLFKVKERRKVEKWILQAQKAFPQLYFCVATVSLDSRFDLRSYGYWLMNRHRIEGLSETVHPGGCVMILLEANQKQSTMLFGYLLDQFIEELEVFDALVPAHPELLARNHTGAVKRMLKGAKRYLKRLHRRAKRAERRAM